MQIFTYEETHPSEKTLRLIKEIAYTYRVEKCTMLRERFCSRSLACVT